MRVFSQANLFNEDDWRLCYTEPGAPKRRNYFKDTPENLYSNSTLAPAKEKSVIFTHFDISRRLWEYLIFILSVLPIFEVPIFTFVKKDFTVWGYLPFVLTDFIMLADIFVVTHTSYLSHGIVVTDLKRIFRRYGWTSLCIQIVGCAPLSWIGIVIHNHTVYFVLGLLRFLRLRRGIQATENITRSLVYSKWTSTLLPFLVLDLCFIHFFAIMFYLAASLEGISESWIGKLGWNSQTPSQQYVISIYFVMTTIFTIGYGDLTPQTSPETILVIFIQLIGVMINAYCIGIMVSILIDPIGTDFLSHFKGLSGYLSFKKIPKNLQHDIKDFFQLKWAQNHGTSDPSEVYRYIPETVRDHLKRDISRKCISQVNVFRMASEGLLIAAADLLRSVSFVPGEVLIEQGAVEPKLMMLNSGVIQLSIDGVAHSTTGCDAGVAIGEEELFVDSPRPITVKALTYVEGWTISRDDLLLCLAHRPEIRPELLEHAMLVFPSKYREIKRLLSGRNVKAEVEKLREAQKQMIARILANQPPEGSESSSEDEQKDI